MKDFHSLPLYYWMIEQFNDQLRSARTWNEMANRARKAFLLQALILLHKSGQRSPPFDPFKVVKFRRIHKITWINSGEEEASLIPDMKGFHLILRKPKERTYSTSNEIKTNVRIRSTVAHEVGHTFFFDIKSLPPKPGPEKYKFEGIPTEVVRKKEEWWSYDFARQLLLPDKYIREFITNHSTSTHLGLALWIKEKFNVSWDIILRKLIYDLKIWSPYAVFRIQCKYPQIILRNRHKDWWRGNNSKIKNISIWLSQNMEFIRHCLRKINNMAISTKEVVRFGNSYKKYLIEFLRIYDEPQTFLCLVEGTTNSLNKYI